MFRSETRNILVVIAMLMMSAGSLSGCAAVAGAAAGGAAGYIVGNETKDDD